MFPRRHRGDLDERLLRLPLCVADRDGIADVEGGDEQGIGPLDDSLQPNHPRVQKQIDGVRGIAAATGRQRQGGSCNYYKDREPCRVVFRACLLL